MPTFYDNLAKQGDYHLIPTTDPFTSLERVMRPSSSKNRATNVPASSKQHSYAPTETVQQRQQRYGVWSEYRGRPVDHIDPPSPARIKALHRHATQVFNHVEDILRQALKDGL